MVAFTDDLLIISYDLCCNCDVLLCRYLFYTSHFLTCKSEMQHRNIINGRNEWTIKRTLLWWWIWISPVLMQTWRFPPFQNSIKKSTITELAQSRNAALSYSYSACVPLTMRKKPFPHEILWGGSSSVSHSPSIHWAMYIEVHGKIGRVQICMIPCSGSAAVG